MEDDCTICVCVLGAVERLRCGSWARLVSELHQSGSILYLCCAAMLVGGGCTAQLVCTAACMPAFLADCDSTGRMSCADSGIRAAGCAADVAAAQLGTCAAQVAGLACCEVLLLAVASACKLFAQLLCSLVLAEQTPQQHAN
jgi:hypothetical protein